MYWRSQNQFRTQSPLYLEGGRPQPLVQNSALASVQQLSLLIIGDTHGDVVIDLGHKARD
jgi:hypothetical protein